MFPKRLILVNKTLMNHINMVMVKLSRQFQSKIYNKRRFLLNPKTVPIICFVVTFLDLALEL